MKYIKLFENFDNESIDEICKEYEITNYTINDDGSIDVDDDVDLEDQSLNDIPLNFRNVSGDFSIGGNLLSNLEGCPSYVGGNFDCRYNNLTTLKGGPSYMVGNFDCEHNYLVNLEGCPQHIVGNFDCKNNKISSLEYSPNYIGGNFECYENNIKSLQGLITNINGDLLIEDKLKIIYDILKDNIECIPFFYQFHIIEDYDLTDDFQSLNLKRLNKFIYLYDLEELSEEQLEELQNYYDII